MAITVEVLDKQKPKLLHHALLFTGKLYHAYYDGEPNGAIVLATSGQPVVLRPEHDAPTSVGKVVSNTHWKYSPADDAVVTITNEA